MSGDRSVHPSEAGFEVVRRGYDQAQVHEHLSRIDTEIRILAADREAAVDQAAQLGRELESARMRSESLRSQVRTLISPPQSVQGMSERMRSMLRLAEDEVADMLGRTETEIARRRGEAEQEAARLVADAHAEAESVRAQARADAEASADAAAESAARTDAEIEQRRSALRAEQEQAAAQLVTAATAAAEDRARQWAESERQRAEVEEDFTIAMDQRRAEALTMLTRERAEAHDEAAATREASIQ